ncbi:MAG: tetraether lipid synthase Tes [Candidatus Hodarchaeales archaeon]
MSSQHKIEDQTEDISEKGSMTCLVTQSLCPTCLKVIPAEIFHREGQIMMKKECNEHGSFEEVYWSDSELYDYFNLFQVRGVGIQNPRVVSSNDVDCPNSCGLCSSHQTHTSIGLIDVTNRCNLNCPICFANARIKGWVYEPSLEQIRKMMVLMRNQKPYPVNHIMLAGGEPTIRDDIFEIVSISKNLGFGAILIATNGVKLAKSVTFTKDLKEAGVNVVYLQFDGLDTEIYEKTRGYNALPQRIAAIENCRKADLTVILVPTVDKQINGEQAWKIIEFAWENRDIIRGVNFQPISFCGRIEKTQRINSRITIPDLIHSIERDSGDKISINDWTPIPIIAKLEELLCLVQKRPPLMTTTNAFCGAMQTIWEADDGMSFIPLNQVINHKRVFEIASEEIELFKGRHLFPSLRTKLSFFRKLRKEMNSEKAPSYMKLHQLVLGLIFKKFYTPSSELYRKVMFLGSMHFMDPYNYDIQRVQKCCIHYATPDGRLIPFCNYNNLPRYRKTIEQNYKHPLSTN